MLRGDMWVSKSKVPAVFREVCDNTFTPSIITGAFRKCGIYPLDRKAISEDLIVRSPSEVYEQLKESNLQDVGSIPPVATTEPRKNVTDKLMKSTEMLITELR